jgi:hypothetical protein
MFNSVIQAKVIIKWDQTGLKLILKLAVTKIPIIHHLAKIFILKSNFRKEYQLN